MVNENFAFTLVMLNATAFTTKKLIPIIYEADCSKNVIKYTIKKKKNCDCIVSHI